MSFELRLKKLKDAWVEIQKLREEQQINRKKIQNLQARNRELGQDIPKKLNEYNQMMV